MSDKKDDITMTDDQIKSISGNFPQPKEYYRITPDGKIILGKDLVIDEVAELFFKELQEALDNKVKRLNDQVWCDEDVIMKLSLENAKLKNTIKELFELLDYTTSTDDGRDYHPITIGCSRALMIPKLEKVIHDLKELTKE